MNNKLKIITSLFVFLLLLNCQNEEVGLDTESGSVANAKKWLEINKPKLQALDYTKEIDWKNAFVTYGDEGKVVEVPLVLVANTSTNVVDDSSYKTHMRLLFMEDKNGAYKVYTIVITTKDLSFDNKNKEFNFYEVDSDYSGYLTLQNSKNKILYSGKYEKGKRISTPRKGNNVTAKWVCSYMVTVGTYTTCSNWVWVFDPNDPEWLLVKWGWNSLDDYNNTYGGGEGNSDPFPDPCEISKKTTLISQDSDYLSAKNTIMNASTDGLEHSITLGRGASSEVTQSPMNSGGPVNVVTNTTLPGAFAGLHNHPNNGPISAGDIYAAVKLNEKSTNFTTSFVFTNGDTYAIVIGDLRAAQSFVNEYPADQLPGMNPEFPDVLFDEMQRLVTYTGSSIEGKTMAMSYVLHQYTYGFTILKQQTNGEFKAIEVEKSKNPDGSEIYTLTPCN
ncbi:hypothetical protein [uncultured Flavobacterium sp.]|uniref:hypothetical protein n=1 Tax=uncultured Flavobacterium sp. TaxID=165435 RepID=UPI00292E1D4B|nr:hypothetical protein [uncultured Flavobacterium sp.]